MNEYKDGKGDYYLSIGLSEDELAEALVRTVTMRQLQDALEDAKLIIIDASHSHMLAMSFEAVAERIWLALEKK